MQIFVYHVLISHLWACSESPKGANDASTFQRKVSSLKPSHSQVASYNIIGRMLWHVLSLWD